MSLYNMVYGTQPATFYILPMLANKHPESYPRFRDCFIGKMTRGKEKDHVGSPMRITSNEDLITVFMRIGGPNRKDYEQEISELQKHLNYVEDYDDSFDKTFACFVFDIPDEYKKDFQLIKEGKIKETSDNYKQRILAVFPKIKDTLLKILY